MSHIYERKIVIKTQCEIEERGPVIAVRQKKENFFVSSKEYHAIKIT
jgi:hypothetical protein